MKIILDAGHGMDTPGKRSPDGLKEYIINRAIANYARDALSQYANTQILFTHNDKVDVPLQTRTKQANAAKGDCLVSIHSNAAGNGKAWHPATGIETYVYLKHSPATKTLAEHIHHQLIATAGLPDRGIKTADFHMLRETVMPAVLVECGFMTNQGDRQLLGSPLFQKTCGEAIASGIARTFSLSRPQQMNLPKKAAAKGLYKVQVGAYGNRQNADALAQKLTKQGYPAYIIFEQS
ncbi:N-acetylmuramoyl-L-alanine amidase [Bacillus testis]|uniref:N-acetylmuramoyl-L-alanine amidase n=1 Tax=Bacillus testis TaxID=1622072 RepID=UPI00067EE9C8|nr:N-acetylmuramoyl-L-alanine amidase [Bacillus testis]